jgi:DNA-binding PadR family transcriptional regulator
MRGFGRFGGGPGPFGERMRRGGMKFAVLAVLAAGARHGYDILTEIEQRRKHRPSAGAIYPVLQMLEDRGCVTSAEVDGKRVYTITDAGLELLAENGEEDDDERAEGGADLRSRCREAAMRLTTAFMSMRAANDEELEKAIVILDRARRDIHRLLAGEEKAE